MRIVNLPRYGNLDIEHLPDDFEQRIQRAFLAFTEGTAKEYRFVDKLAYIDVCVKYLRGQQEYPEDAVKRIILEREEFNLDEYGELPDRDEYWSLEFMGAIYEKGIHDAKLYNSAGNGEKYIVERALIRIIKAVMEVE